MSDTYFPALVVRWKGALVPARTLNRAARAELFPRDGERDSPYGTSIEADEFPEGDVLMRGLQGVPRKVAEEWGRKLGASRVDDAPRSGEEVVRVRAHVRGSPDDGDSGTSEFAVPVVAHTRSFPGRGGASASAGVGVRRDGSVVRMGMGVGGDVGLPEAFADMPEDVKTAINAIRTANQIPDDLKHEIIHMLYSAAKNKAADPAKKVIDQILNKYFGTELQKTLSWYYIDEATQSTTKQGEGVFFLDDYLAKHASDAEAQGYLATVKKQTIENADFLSGGGLVHDGEKLHTGIAEGFSQKYLAAQAAKEYLGSDAGSLAEYVADLHAWGVRNGVYERGEMMYVPYATAGGANEKALGSYSVLLYGNLAVREDGSYEFGGHKTLFDYWDFDIKWNWVQKGGFKRDAETGGLKTVLYAASLLQGTTVKPFAVSLRSAIVY